MEGIGNLILERQKGEGVKVGGDIHVTIHRIMGKHVWLSIQAPKSIPVVRDELCQQGSDGKESPCVG